MVKRLLNAFMASQLILDKKDPGIAELVKNWTLGETYKAEVEFTFDKDGPTQAQNTVTSTTPITEEIEEVAPPPTPKQPIPISYRK